MGLTDIKRIVFKGILAGICISFGGTAFLKVGGIVGAVLFSFGLLTVVHYKLPLYTGTAGFFKTNSKNEWFELLLILISNIIGCSLVSVCIINNALPELTTVAESIMSKRIESGFVNCGLLAICCGFIMTTSVEFARKNQFLPLLFGVPLFIICGFTHSIADAFYFICCGSKCLTFTVITIYISEVIGNFIGCNLYRALTNGIFRTEKR